MASDNLYLAALMELRKTNDLWPFIEAASFPVNQNDPAGTSYTPFIRPTQPFYVANWGAILGYADNGAGQYEVPSEFLWSRAGNTAAQFSQALATHAAIGDPLHQWYTLGNGRYITKQETIQFLLRNYNGAIINNPGAGKAWVVGRGYQVNPLRTNPVIQRTLKEHKANGKELIPWQYGLRLTIPHGSTVIQQDELTLQGDDFAVTRIAITDSRSNGSQAVPALEVQIVPNSRNIMDNAPVSRDAFVGAVPATTWYLPIPLTLPANDIITIRAGQPSENSEVADYFVDVVLHGYRLPVRKYIAKP